MQLVDTNKTETFQYDDAIVKKFLIATIVWAGVAFLVGIWAALELASYKFNLGLQWFTFGRLRPLHTNAAIFAFAGNAIFAGIYHSSQRLLKTRMWNDSLSKIHFWGWQLIIVMAAITIPLGFVTGKEYAELEWPIDIAIALVWVLWGINYFKTIQHRREPHLYVAIWFYLATIITIALLHVVNSIAIPVTLLKSYPVYAGVQDALVQWWYGHNAVAFFLTTPFLGLMYYYIPKAVGKPVYSYSLSVIHFWSIVFIYIWAGPHHLLYTALPEWAQTLGTVFSIMLWIPSWGGMINGLLTLRGAWDRVRTEPTLKFLAAATTFYGMATFEGPLLSLKSVSALGHYTDWIISHVHSGALGWNGFLAFGMIYYLVPKLWKTNLYSTRLANWHFWLGTLGILLYVLSMWASGITQGLMWRAVDEAGKLVYPDFVETVVRIVPLYWIRAVGGLLYFLGYILMVINVFQTIAHGAKDNAPETVKGNPLNITAEGIREVMKRENPHRTIEMLPALMSVLVVLAVLVGTIVELVPMLTAMDAPISADGTDKIRPYRPLEIAGRDIYIREGCYVCHSQMIRPMVSEVLRYGAPSTMDESAYDHPFQWGSKRTGPDLARIGGKYPNLWHFRHMLEPRDVIPGSIMPAYDWLVRQKTDFEGLRKRLWAMSKVGVPYSADEIAHAGDDARAQAQEIAREMMEQGGPEGMENKEITAMIAYLQALGKLQTGVKK